MMSLFTRKSAAAAVPVVVALASVFGQTMTADAQTVYVESSANEFGTVSLQTGVFTQLNDPNNPLSVTFDALGFAPNGTLYGLASSADGTDLYSIDATNGNLLTEANVSKESINGGAISGDTFYALSSAPDPTTADPNPSADLFTVDTSTGTSSLVQSQTGIQADGMTVLDGSGSLYAADTSHSGLDGDDGIDVIAQNGTSITAPFLGDGDTGLSYLYSGVFSSGKLYGFADDSTTGVLGVYTISTLDGSSTLVAPITGLTGTALFAAALAPSATPEPAPCAALALGSIGIGALMLRARRRSVEACRVA